MPLYLNGTEGVSGINGTNSTPANRGSDTNTGIVYGTDTVQIATGGTTAVTVDSSQNVGIGTTSPSSYGKLAVLNGNVIAVSNSSSSSAALRTSNNNNYVADWVVRESGYSTYGAITANCANLYYGYGDICITADGSNNIKFGTGSGAPERARIDSSGNLLVGATNSVARFYAVSGANNVPAGRFDIGVSGDVAQAAVYVVKFDNNSTTSQVFHKFFINGGASGCGQINANGAGAAAFGSTSDARLKENIEAIPNQLSNILALKPSEFDFKDGSGHQIGFIAQEMQQVYPDAINENDEGFLTITGWGRTEARLVKAIQELSAKLDAAEARIAALEAK